MDLRDLAYFEVIADLGHMGRAAEELATRLLARFVGREVSHLVPVLGAAAGAALNYGAVRAVGRAALRRVERLYGPPELPGTGLILDASGSVS